MNIELLKSCIVNGQAEPVGAQLTVDDNEARYLCAIKKARGIKEINAAPRKAEKSKTSAKKSG